jgi:anti-sigma-K factor RskA
MMNNANYPGLYRYANSASLKAQRTYLCLHKLYLGSLVLSSAAGTAATLEISALNTWLFATMAIVLALGFLILWIMRARQDDKIWFDGRAVAESAKTVTWRFMMKVPPFHEDNKAEDRFISQLKEIRGARPHLGKHMAAVQDANGLSITDFMHEKRAATLEERRAFYVSDRLADQRSWYAKNAKLNAKSSARWFWIVAALQIAAVVLAVIQAVSKGLGINIVPAITTCAAAFAAWGQMKRYDELAQSYALAAQELEELKSLSSSQTAVEDFAQFIEQAENSISREHTMWCARRDVRLTMNRAH